LSLVWELTVNRTETNINKGTQAVVSLCSPVAAMFFDVCLQGDGECEEAIAAHLILHHLQGLRRRRAEAPEKRTLANSRYQP
jgi:hypothetical protein